MEKANNKKMLQLFIGFFLSAFFIYLSYKKIGNINFSSIKGYHINYVYVLVGVAFFNICVLIRALLWCNVLVKDFSLGLTYKALFLGMGANLVLPFRIGEVVKIAVFRNGCYIKKNDKTKFYYNVVGNMAIERFTDFLIMFISCVLALAFIGFNKEIAQRIALFRNVSIIVLVAIILVISVIRYFKIYDKITYKPFNSLMEATRNLKGKVVTNKLIKVIVLLSFSWLSVYFSILFSMLGLNIDSEIAKTAAFIILIMTNIAVIFPAAPGGLGLFEYACIYSLSLFGITGLTAGLSAIILHLVQYAAIIPVAIIILIVYRDKAIIKDIKLSRYEYEKQK